MNYLCTEIYYISYSFTYFENIFFEKFKTQKTIKYLFLFNKKIYFASDFLQKFSFLSNYFENSKFLLQMFSQVMSFKKKVELMLQINSQSYIFFFPTGNLFHRCQKNLYFGSWKTLVFSSLKNLSIFYLVFMFFFKKVLYSF